MQCLVVGRGPNCSGISIGLSFWPLGLLWRGSFLSFLSSDATTHPTLRPLKRAAGGIPDLNQTADSLAESGNSTPRAVHLICECYSVCQRYVQQFYIYHISSDDTFFHQYTHRLTPRVGLDVQFWCGKHLLCQQLITVMMFYSRQRDVSSYSTMFNWVTDRQSL